MNSLIWKRLISKFYPVFFRKNNFRKIILIYHSVGNSPWALSTENFNQQIKFLKKNCEVVALSELLKNADQKNAIQVALTFDDGYACLYHTVLPILQAENITATAYINTGWVGDCENMRKDSHIELGHYPNEKFLIWDEVKMLDQQGWEIGSHGVDHIDLTRKPEKLVKQELINSKSEIENKLQKPCKHFAYTWARHTDFLQKYVRDTNYQYAVAGCHGPVDSHSNLFALPRMSIALEYTLNDFQGIVDGRWDFLGFIHQWKRKQWISSNEACH